MKVRGILRQGALAFFISNSVYLLNFVGNIVLVRMLSPEDFGVVALALSLLGLVEIVTTFALNTVLIQHRDSESLVRSIFQAAIVVGGIKVFASLVLVTVFAGRYEEQIWILFLMMLTAKLLTGVGPLMVAQLEKSGEFLRASLIVGGTSTAGVLGAIVAVASGTGVYGLALRETLPPVLLFLVMVLFFPGLLPKGLSKVNRRQLRVVMQSSLKLYFQRGAELAFMRIPLLMIENIFGAATLGLYSQATYLVTVVNRVTSVANQQIATVFFSRNRKQQAETKKGFQALLVLNLAIAVPGAAILEFFPDTVVRVLWKESWVGAVPFLRVMAVMTVILPLFTLFKSRLLGLRRNSAITISYLVGSAVFCGGLAMYPNSMPSAEFVGGVTVLCYTIMVVACASLLSPRVRGADGAQIRSE